MGLGAGYCTQVPYQDPLQQHPMRSTRCAHHYVHNQAGVHWPCTRAHAQPASKAPPTASEGAKMVAKVPLPANCSPTPLAVNRIALVDPEGPVPAAPWSFPRSAALAEVFGSLGGAVLGIAAGLPSAAAMLPVSMSVSVITACLAWRRPRRPGKGALCALFASRPTERAWAALHRCGVARVQAHPCMAPGRALQLDDVWMYGGLVSRPAGHFGPSLATLQHR